jgi:hypothetical protein
MLEPRDESDLAPEALQSLAGGELGRKNFDDDWTVQLGVTSGVHATLHAATELGADFVLSSNCRLQALSQFHYDVKKQASRH